MTIREKLEGIREARANRVAAMAAEVEAVELLYKRLSPTDECLEHAQCVRDIDPEVSLVYGMSGDKAFTFQEIEAS